MRVARVLRSKARYAHAKSRLKWFIVALGSYYSGTANIVIGGAVEGLPDEGGAGPRGEMRVAAHTNASLYDGVSTT